MAARSARRAAPGVAPLRVSLAAALGAGFLAAGGALRPAPSSAAVRYRYLGAGFLAAGGDVQSGNMTLADAEALCSSLPTCCGITWRGDDPAPAGTISGVFLKSQTRFSNDTAWQSYATSRPCAPPFGPEVTAYRALVANQSKDSAAWTAAAAAVRAWTTARDPHSPTFHFRSVEGWINDPNGLHWDASSGLYHRFYQSRLVGGAFDGRTAWGSTVSPDLVLFADLPVAMYPDSAWDSSGVFSGNCVVDDADGVPSCVYTGFLGSHGSSEGVCARSEDKSWVNFTKADCMDSSRKPNPATAVSWDSSVWRDNNTYFCLVGGCTADSQGTGFIWASPDLVEWELATPTGLWPGGGPCSWWELPYLLPFNDAGKAAPHETATRHALIFGCGNSYFVGSFNRSSLLFQRQASQSEAFIFDPGASYSINPSFVDNKDAGGGLRRIMLTWVTGPASPTAAVPYWQGAHSIPSVLSLSGLDTAPSTLLQHPLPELESLRGAHFAPVRVTAAAGANESALAAQGDALEVSFAVDLAASANATRVGLLLRLTPTRDHYISVWLNPATLAFGTDSVGACGAGCEDSDGDTIGRGAWRQPRPPPGALVAPGTSADCSGDGAARNSGTATLRAFVDKSVLEIFCGGGAIRARDFPADPAEAIGIAPFAEGPAGATGSGTVEAWAMGSMWTAAA